MSEPNYQPLVLNSRMYQYIRASAITNLDDALVELITNSIDAYNNIDNQPNKINVILSKLNNTVEVCDQAIGMSADLMKLCFLQVGTYVSNEVKRGHFSRGAKDITALGDCTFIAIKDNLCSSCKILYDGRGAMLFEDVAVTQEHRDQTGIVNNGLYVKLDIKRENIISDFNLENFPYHFALRDIFSNGKYEIKYTDKDNQSSQVIKYNFPDAELIIDGEYTVPYNNVQARFTLYLSENKNMKYSNNFRYNENGFIVSSNNTIYENGMLHNRLIQNNPHSQKIFGRVHCDYINTLLKDYEVNGPSSKNPFPIIDSSRLQGINYYHPFARHLFRLPIERINFILSELEYKAKKDLDKSKITELLNNNDLQKINDDIFKKLGIMLVSEFKLEKIEEILLPPIVQKFNIENPVLKYSKPNVEKIRRDINNKLLRDAARLSINFVDYQIEGKYETFATNEGITINIKKDNPIFNKYLLNVSDPTQAMADTRVRSYIADVIVESFSDILTSAELNNQELSNISTSQLVELFNSTYNKNYSNFEKQIYEIILS